MNKVKAYSQAHKVRRYFKRIQQISYALNRIDSTFDLDQLTESELEDFFIAHHEAFGEIIALAEELKSELKLNATGQTD